MIILLFWLSGLSLFDMRYRRVPVWMIVPGGIAAAGIGIYECVCGESSFAALLPGMIPGAVLLLLAISTQKAGWVDGIVLMILGAFLELWQCVLTAMISLIMISVLSAILLMLKKADKETTIPYVPFLTMGFVLCELIGG